jgi:hypothetical protein
MANHDHLFVAPESPVKFRHPTVDTRGRAYYTLPEPRFKQSGGFFAIMRYEYDTAKSDEYNEMLKSSPVYRGDITSLESLAFDASLPWGWAEGE